MDPVTELVGLPQAARVAGWPYLRLWHAVVSGDVPAERRGGRWYVRREDAERLARGTPTKPSNSTTGRS